MLQALFCVVIRRDLDSLLRFPFLSHVFSCEMSLVCRLKCQHNCFSSHALVGTSYRGVDVIFNASASFSPFLS